MTITLPGEMRGEVERKANPMSIRYRALAGAVI